MWKCWIVLPTIGITAIVKLCFVNLIINTFLRARGGRCWNSPQYVIAKSDRGNSFMTDPVPVSWCIRRVIGPRFGRSVTFPFLPQSAAFATLQDQATPGIRSRFGVFNGGGRGGYNRSPGAAPIALSGKRTLAPEAVLLTLGTILRIIFFVICCQ